MKQFFLHLTLVLAALLPKQAWAQELYTEVLSDYRSASFVMLLSNNGGTADYSNNNYFRLGNGGSLTLYGNSNVDNIVSVKLHYKDSSRMGSNVTVSSGILEGDSITDINATSVTITSEGMWPQLWLTSLEVTYQGTSPLSQHAVILQNVSPYGTLTADRLWANTGNLVTLYAVPNANCSLGYIGANDGSVTLSKVSNGSGQYTFYMPDGDVVVWARFDRDEGGVWTGLQPHQSTSGVDGVSTVAYNLNGQRLDVLQKGVNIIAGKKIVRKE